MTYSSVYEAVYDQYDVEQSWEEHVHVGDRETLNIAQESLGRHADSDATGLRIRDFESGDTETYTFAELNAAANRVANYLEAHTERGDRVAAMLPTRLELYAVVFGSVKAGRIYMPLAPVFGSDALNYRLEDSSAAILFAGSQGSEAVDGDLSALDRVVTIGGGGNVGGEVAVDEYDVLHDEDDGFDAVETHPNDPYTLTYTSGTTGQPKGVPSPHGGVVELYAYAEYVADVRPDDVYLVAASPSWSYGLNMGTIMSGIRGTAIGCYRGQFDPVTFFETLERWDVDNAMIPPTALRQSRAAGIDLQEWDIDLRVLISAGESLDEDTVEWCENGLGALPQDAYGLTEGGMAICNFAFDDWEVKPGSMGKVTPGYEVALLDDEEEVAQGETGEIAIKREEDDFGWYWGRPEKTLETFTGKWLRTGDLAQRDDDGYYWYVSRADNVIISSGYRIGPEEVESSLLNHEAVEEAAVIGKADQTRGEIVKAFITLAEGREASTGLRDEVSEFARENLSKHEYPREVEIIDELPKTASGKIKRAQLRE
jgi:acetyl-CoA synthetase